MDFPSAIHSQCPNCDQETLHKVLKGRVGKNKQLTLDCTIQCSSCNFIHHTTISDKKMIKVPIIMSMDERSIKTSIELHPDEILNLDQELILDENNVTISSLEVGPNRVKSAMAKDVIGSVKTTKGIVTIIRVDTKHLAKIGFKIQQNDIIKTGADGAVGIIFIDDTILALGPDTEFVMDYKQQDQAGET